MADEKRFDKIDMKLDKISDHLSEIDISLVEQNAILKEHQRRSMANEKMVELLAAELKPIKKRITMAEGVIKFLGILMLLGGLYEFLKKFV